MVENPPQDPTPKKPEPTENKEPKDPKRIEMDKNPPQDLTQKKPESSENKESQDSKRTEMGKNSPQDPMQKVAENESTKAPIQEEDEPVENFEPIIAPKKHPPITRDLRYMGGILLGMLAISLIWAALAPLDSVAIAPGVITVASSNKVIQNQQGGTIKKVYVTESQQVQENDPLILLDDPQILAKRDALQQSLLFNLAKKDRLQSTFRDSPHIEFSPELTALADDPEVKRLMQTENNLFEKNLHMHTAEIQILEEQFAQLEKQYIQAQALLKSTESQKKYLLEELEAVRYLEKQKLVRKPRLLALERENARLEGEQIRLQTELLRNDKQKEEVKARIRSQIQTRKQKTVSDLEETEKQLLEIPPQLLAAQEIQKGLLIRSPVAGTVKGLRFKSPGQVVRAADPIMEIVPVLDQLVVEAHVDPADIDVVKPNLPAKVQITSLSYRYTPSIFGRVEYVSTDAFVDQNTNRSYYLVRVSHFDPEWKTLSAKLTPGMPVEVMIVNDQRSLLSYLFAPIRDSFRRAFKEE